MRKRKKPPLKRSTPRKQIKPSESVIDTEGIQYVIDWDKYPINGFVFIKCVETDKVMKTLRQNASRRGLRLVFRVGIRNGYWGVGVWRIQ